MKVGYFKVAPTVPAIVSSRDRSLSLASGKKLAMNPRDKWKLITIPLTGLVLALMLVGSLKFGVKLANYDLPQERLSSVTDIDLPENVLFMASAYESAYVFWNDLIVLGRSIFKQEAPSSLIVSTEQLGSSSPATLFEGKLNPDKKVYAVLALPASGVIEIDEELKGDLRQAFADPVDIKFDSTGRSGTITPILPGGKRGNNYVFVLTSAR